MNLELKGVNFAAEVCMATVFFSADGMSTQSTENAADTGDMRAR
jgi:hypothetical protein